jgi:CheY-like chemotaxis protein
MALAQQHDTRDSAPKRRLLVVDDNRDAAESMSMLLQMWGHDVVFAYDGPTALETAEQWHPEAVFLDIGLPGMDGYEVAARLRELPHAKGAVLIAITGYGQDDDRLRSQRAGIDHHLVKPVAPDALRSLIDSLQVH